jgi:hypothetical protein
MRQLLLRSSLVVAAALVTQLLQPHYLPGQATPTGAGPTSPTPRRADGKPDLNGVWTDRFDGSGLGANATLEETQRELASNGGIVSSVMAPSRLGGLYSGEQDGKVKTKGDRNKPMYKPEYWAQVRDNELHSQQRDPEFHCAPWGVPRMGAPQQIIQQDNQVAFLYSSTSFANTFRVIPMNRPHDPNRVAQETSRGDSVGHWEGDTLVVDTIGFNDETWLTGRLGYIHSTSLHVIERLTRQGDKIKYEVTIEDPEMLLQPWVWKPRTISLNPSPTAMLPEDLPCSERDEAYTPVR